LDGVVVETSGACPGVTLPYFFSIGNKVSNFPDIPSYFPGKIDEVAAFDHALSASDVQSLYNLAAAVILNIKRSGASLELQWSHGTLMQADTVNGLYTPVNGASSPWPMSPAGAKKFYRVQVQ
jgi:hypothetical protein